jgi:Cu2+-exporting ATPase
VYHALRDAGLDDTFYRLRDVRSNVEIHAAGPGPDTLFLAELDSAPFLATHSQVLADGYREGTFQLEGIHCAGCVWLVEQMPHLMPGVAEARLNLVRGRLRLRWDPARVLLSDAARWLGRFGYRLQPITIEPAGASDTERRQLRRVGAAWALAGNVMLLAFAEYAGLDAAAEPQLAAGARGLSFALTGVALVHGGRPFFTAAWQAIRTSVRRRSLRHIHMDTPIALGVLVAFLQSGWITLKGDPGGVWFDSISVLIAALLTARWLQFRSLRWAKEAADRLLRLIPVMARRVVDGAERTLVPCTSLAAGDTIEVLAGEVVPVDGSVVAGHSAVDQAALTGESRPVTVGMGAPVAAGVINRSGDLLVRVSAAGEETRLGRLLTWVDRSATDRAPTPYLVDRIGAYFVLAVLGLTAVTGAVWAALDPSRAVFHMVALLVITCPCALAMTTPLSLAVATGRAARRGVFVKHEGVFQTIHEADTVVFDKTGTLTAGRLRIVDLEGDPEALIAAGVLEQGLTHPVASAFAEYGLGAKPSVRHAVPGHGVEGKVDGRQVRVGRPEWAFASGDVTGVFESAIDTYSRHGHVTIGIAVDGRPAAVVGLADTVRPEAKALLDRLRASGKTIRLLSGDHPNVVRFVADRLGIPASDAFAHETPEDKLALVQRWEKEGRRVVMVGDGVNDAAALRAASLGIAVAGTLSPGFSAADVYTSRDGLAGVAYLAIASGEVVRRIRLALGFSLAYNLAGAAAAMAGLVHPLLAALAMPVSSLLVAVLASVPASFDFSRRASP